MATPSEAPFRAQVPQEVTEMIHGLNERKGKGKRNGISVKRSTFNVVGSTIKVDSWKMQDWDYKKPDLPTYSRGLFTTKTAKGKDEIAVRGYDKFFNHGEVRETEWENVEKNTRGPYELSVKENGCIIFIAGLEDGSLIVCSKHSTGPRSDVDVSHASAGEKWVDRHLASVGKTRQQLAFKLREMNATAVAELCDDEFEEHVLAYAPEAAGLYLHGINLNLPEFATYPHNLVDRFADEWGFKKTMYIVKDDIKEVKTFLDNIAETGNYDGRDTEGFVIRCQSKANTDAWHDWFFKYKFEEPYLMYRQWRECTKAVIAAKEPKFKKHKKITEEYIMFARKQLHANPQLAKEYNNNHGIIKMRDDFLSSRGLKGADIIRQEAEEGEVGNDDVKRDVVLVPAATLGCGKTTVGLALCKLFGWGQVQNDNITVKKGKPQAFAHECCRVLTTTSAVVADRNNHQRRERKQLIEDMSRVVPHARFVCLHYVHERSNYDHIREVTRQRVLNRGDNHQTIQANSKGEEEIVSIMEGFMYRFESVDQETPPDDGFDLVIPLDVLASSRENLETIVTRLYTEYPKLFGDQDMPSSSDMDQAIEAAMNEYTVDIKHDVGRGGGGPNAKQRNHPNGQQPKQPKEKKMEYFAVQLPASRVLSILDACFRDSTDPEQAQFYNILKQQRRLQSEFHVTLVHRAMADKFPNDWSHLMARYQNASASTATRDYPLPDAELGRVNVRLERIVWDSRVMCFVVRMSPAGGEEFRSVNPTAHITLGTANGSIKPVESNFLLEKWVQEGAGGSDGNGIREYVVKGNVELEGVVKGVGQRF